MTIPRLLANDQSPNEVKWTSKADGKLEAANTFEAVARELLVKKAVKQVDKTRNCDLRVLELNVFKLIGSTSINKVTSKAQLVALDKMERRIITYSAHRALHICGELFRYVIANEFAQAV